MLDRVRAALLDAGTLIVLASSFFFAVTSPYGAVTYLPFLARWAYWLGLMTMVRAVFVGYDAIQTRLGWSQSRWWVALIASLLSTPVVWATIIVVQQLIDVPVPRDFLPQLAGSVWLVCFALTLVYATLLSAEQKVDEDRSAVHKSDPADILRQRLPAALRGDDILAVAAQDHYVMVYLTDGKHLVHMRFGDAAELLSLQDGLTVHRSWWIARRAVADTVRSNRRLTLTLTNGETVPVSRSGAKRLREAGWL